MSTVSFDNLQSLNLLWVVLGVAAMALFGIWRRRVALWRFAAASLLPRLTPATSWVRPVTRLAVTISRRLWTCWMVKKQRRLPK